MKLEIKRPLVAMALSYFIALFFSFFCTSLALGILGAFWGVILFCALVGCVIFCKVPRRTVICLLLCVLSSIGGCAAIDLTFQKYDRQLTHFADHTVHITGTVEEVSFEAVYATYYRLHVSEMEEKPCSFYLQVEAPFSAGVAPYQIVSLEGTILPLSSEENAEDTYWMLADQCLGTLTLSSEADQAILGNGKRPFTAVFVDMRNYFEQRFHQFLSNEDATLTSAILLGDREDLDPVLNRDFRRMGISHVLSVSGMHLSIIIGGLISLLELLCLPKHLRYAIAIVFVILFMGIVGFSSSVVRSGIMLILFYIGYFVRGKPDGVTSLFAASFLICVVSPLSAFDIGLQLSVLSTLGLLTMGQLFSNFFKRRFPYHNIFFRIFSLLPTTIANTFSAVVFTVPVIYFQFHELSILSPLSNLLILLPVTLLMYFSPLLLFLGSIPVLGSCFAWVVGLACDLTRYITLLADLPNSLISLRYPFVLPIFLIALFLTVLCFYKFRKWFVPYVGAGTVCLLFAVCLFVFQTARADLPQVRYYHDESGNEALAIGVNDRLCLIDQSTGTYRRLSLSADHALSTWYTEIDTLILTHLHQRYVSSLPRLCQRVYVRTVFLPTPKTKEESDMTQQIIESLSLIRTDVCFFDDTLEPLSEKVHGSATMSGETSALEKNKTVESDAPQTISFENIDIRVVFCGYLNRSVQKQMMVTLTTNQKLLLWLPPAYQENDHADYFQSYIDRADVILFGIHGPKIKEVYTPDLSRNSRNVSIVAAQTAGSMMDPTFSKQFRSHFLKDDPQLLLPLS